MNSLGASLSYDPSHPADLSITTYQYNANAQRIQQDDGVDITRFVYDGNNILQERTDLGVTEADFTYVPAAYAQMVSQHRDFTSSFYHFDGTANTLALTDATNTVTDEYSLDAWGELRSSTGGTPNAHTYKGQFNTYYRDPHAGPESSLYSIGPRFLSAKQKKWTSDDPSEAQLNSSMYAGNNPVNDVDPSGLEPKQDDYVRENGLVVPVSILKLYRAGTAKQVSKKRGLLWDIYDPRAKTLLVGRYDPLTRKITRTITKDGKKVNASIAIKPIVKYLEKGGTDPAGGFDNFFMFRFGRTREWVWDDYFRRTSTDITKAGDVVVAMIVFTTIGTATEFVPLGSIGKRVVEIGVEKTGVGKAVSRVFFKTIAEDGTEVVVEKAIKDLKSDELTQIIKLLDENADDVAKTVRKTVKGKAPTNVRTGRYGDLAKEFHGTGQQANHLNQNAAFKSIIPEEDGLSHALRGNAFTEPGTPHFEFHRSLESFWNQYRRGGSLFRTRPTNAQYGDALEQALRAGGLSPAEAADLAAQAARQRAAYGLSESAFVPRIPGRLPQRRP